MSLFLILSMNTIKKNFLVASSHFNHTISKHTMLIFMRIIKNKNINYGTESTTFDRNIGANASMPFYSKC